MTNIYELPKTKNRYDEASIWVARLDRGLSAAEQRALKTWMAADPENQTVLLEMTRIWDKTTELSRLAELFPEPAPHTVTLPLRSLAMAASVVAVMLAAAWILFSITPGDEPVALQAVEQPLSDTVYETAIGEQSTVNLPDGSQVVLNTNSRIEVEYTVTYRLLRLKRGEIHVQVAEDKARPLSVIAGGKIVQAVGTAFSLEITSDHQIELVVTAGKVLVGVRDVPISGVAGNTPVVLKPDSVLVAAGEELVLGAREEEIIEVSPAEIEIKLSWREGNLIFRGESLEEAMTEIGRYTTVEFVILDDELKRLRIAGLFKAGDVDGLLATLRENFDISNQRTEDGKILLTSL